MSISADDAEEYTAGLGQIVSGSWRQVALGVRLGVPQALGLSTRDWVEDRLGGYVRMSIPDRREAVAELTDEGHSQREAADIVGVSQKTVDRDLDEPESKDSEARPESQESGDLPPTPESKDSKTREPEPADQLPDTEQRELDEALADHVDRDESVQNAKFLAALTKQLKAFTGIKEFEPEHVAEVADELLLANINHAVESLTAWRDDVSDARGAGLRLMKGGAR